MLSRFFWSNQMLPALNFSDPPPPPGAAGPAPDLALLGLEKEEFNRIVTLWRRYTSAQGRGSHILTRRPSHSMIPIFFLPALPLSSTTRSSLRRPCPSSATWASTVASLARAPKGLWNWGRTAHGSMTEGRKVR